MRRVIFVNRFFYPDHSATSQILSDLAFHLAESGREVHVVTSQQLYDQSKMRLRAQDVVRGVQIHRVPTTHFGRSALLGRGFDYLSFYRSARRVLTRLARPDDILVAKTDPPLISIVAMRVARQSGAHLVNWLQDLYPEVAIKLDVPLLKGPIGGSLAYLRNKSLARATATVSVCQRMAENVAALGIDRKRLHVIANWSDDEAIVPVAAAHNPLRRQWRLADRFVIGYSGNLGRAHEWETVFSAAQRLKHDDRFVFLFVGGGHHVDALARRVEQHKLASSFRFMPYQDRSLLKHTLGVADVHWISLKPQVEGLLFPSKFYGVAAAGRPIIAIAARDGDMGRLVEQHACGLAVEPGNGQELADALVGLASQPKRLSDMGQRARAMLDAHFTRRQALERWTRLLDGIQ